MEEALSLLKCPDDETKLVLEGSADVVDYEILVGNRVVEVGQIKTKDEPYQWTPGEIEPIIKRWISDRPDCDRYVFITNGSAGRDIRRLKDIVDSLNLHKMITPEQEKFIAAKFPQIAFPDLARILPRLSLTTRHMDTEDTIERIKHLLANMGVDGDSGAERLFLKIALTSEAPKLSRRILAPSDIAATVGTRWPVSPNLDERLAAYRSVLTLELGKDEPISLDYTLQAGSGGRPDVFGELDMQFIVGNSGGKSETLSLEDLIAKERHLVIEGPAGCGKTTSLRLAAKRLIDTARLIIIAPASMYRGERLEEFLARSLSRQALDINLDAGLSRTVLPDPSPLAGMISK